MRGCTLVSISLTRAKHAPLLENFLFFAKVVRTTVLMDFPFRLEDCLFVLVRTVMVCSTTKGSLGRASLFRVVFPGRSVRLARARPPLAEPGGGGRKLPAPLGAFGGG